MLFIRLHSTSSTFATQSQGLYSCYDVEQPLADHPLNDNTRQHVRSTSTRAIRNHTLLLGCCHCCCSYTASTLVASIGARDSDRQVISFTLCETGYRESIVSTSMLATPSRHCRLVCHEDLLFSCNLIHDRYHVATMLS
jgi:hypothetical protein